MRTNRSGRPVHVWVVSQLYYPEETSTGYFLTEIAEGLAERHAVEVVCGQPTYSKRGIRGPARERRHGVDIHRVSGTTLRKDVAAFRVFNMLTFSAAVFWHVVTRVRRGDVVLVVTTPPVVPSVVFAACLLRGARRLLIVHDVYPDTLSAAGWLPRSSVAMRVLDRIFAGIYSSADRMSVLGRDMAQLVVAKVGQRRAADVRVIANWWEPDLGVSPADGDEFLRSLGLEGKFVVQHAGNLGPLHGVAALVTAIRRLAVEAPNVHFLFIGGGGLTGWMKQQLTSAGVTNYTIVDGLPRSRQRQFLSAAHIAVIAFRSGMFGVGVPSRAYNIFAMSCPMVVAMERDSEVARVIAEEDIGWVVPPDDGEALAAAIADAQRDRRRLNEMGARARAAAEHRFTREIAIDAYRKLVDELVRP